MCRISLKGIPHHCLCRQLQGGRMEIFMKRKALKAAFPYTIPIFAGFWFLGLAYGIYMHASGFSFVYPMLMSLLIFGGSLEFLAVEMLLSPFALLQVFLMSLLIQARHIFYGISMLDKFKGQGWKKYYLIFGMCDESFSINYTAEIPEDVDKGWFMFFVTLLNHFYWFSGSTIGGLAGSLLKIDTTGISFVMTAMFVVIFLEQWFKEERHISSLAGILAAVLCLILFGQDSFMIPTMAVIILFLALSKKKLERGFEAVVKSNSGHISEPVINNKTGADSEFIIENKSGFTAGYKSGHKHDPAADSTSKSNHKYDSTPNHKLTPGSEPEKLRAQNSNTGGRQ